MKNINLLLLLSILIFAFSCKDAKKETTKISETIVVKEENTQPEETVVTEKEETVNEETKTTISEEITKTTISKPKKKENIVSKETNNNTTQSTTEVVKNTANTVVEEVIGEVIEKPKEITTEVTETTNEVVETVEEIIEKPKEEIIPPKPVIQELTLKQKIAKGKALFNTGICTTCHDPKKKKIGPTLIQIAKKYRKKHASIAKFLKGNGKAIVWPDKYFMMKPNVDDVTSKMSKIDLESIETYIMSL